MIANRRTPIAIQRKLNSLTLSETNNISVIPFTSKPRVFDVSIKDGVPTVRMKLE